MIKGILCDVTDVRSQQNMTQHSVFRSSKPQNSGQTVRYWIVGSTFARCIEVIVLNTCLNAVMNKDSAKPCQSPTVRRRSKWEKTGNHLFILIYIIYQLALISQIPVAEHFFSPWQCIWDLSLNCVLILKKRWFYTISDKNSQQINVPLFSHLQRLIAARHNKVHRLQRMAGPGPGKERPVLTRRPPRRGKGSLKPNLVTAQKKVSVWKEGRGKSRNMERDL